MMKDKAVVHYSPTQPILLLLYIVSAPNATTMLTPTLQRNIQISGEWLLVPL